MNIFIWFQAKITFLFWMIFYVSWKWLEIPFYQYWVKQYTQISFSTESYDMIQCLHNTFLWVVFSLFDLLKNLLFKYLTSYFYMKIQLHEDRKTYLKKEFLHNFVSNFWKFYVILRTHYWNMILQKPRSSMIHRISIIVIFTSWQTCNMIL